MTSIEKKKLELELHRVQAARMDLDIRIEEMKEEIKRLAEHIIIQESKELELKDKLTK